jgi:hypothetical protein
VTSELNNEQQKKSAKGGSEPQIILETRNLLDASGQKCDKLTSDISNDRTVLTSTSTSDAVAEVVTDQYINI